MLPSHSVPMETNNDGPVKIDETAKAIPPREAAAEVSPEGREA